MATPFFATVLRGLLAVVVLLDAVFFAAEALRLVGMPSGVVSAIVLVLALNSYSSGEFAFDGATQLARQCSGE
ncbi:hypothetical protein [Qipengyuania pacifica]|uniref:hypothetical protein n=1 Tax=Qipengyuania pacifica TaxID=2860199 RepID=UPI0032119BC0